VAAYHRQFPAASRLARAARGAPGSSHLLPGVDLPVRIFNSRAGRAWGVAAICAPTTRACGCPTSPPRRRRSQQARIDRLLAAFGAAPYAPPNSAGYARQLLGGDAGLLEFLVEQGVLVRLGGDVLLRGVPTLRRNGRWHHRAAADTHGAVTLAEVRDLFQTSRKYAQAVLGEMDARRVTRREGEARVLR
jgi:hypothetical protein